MINNGKVQSITEYTNMETGEITRSKPVLRDMQFSHAKGYLYRFRDNYIKKFEDTPLPKQLTWAEKGKLAELQLYIVGDSQLLGQRKNGKLIPLTIPDISKILECKDWNTYKTIAQAKKYKIIKDVSIDNIIWLSYSPIYGLKGKRLTIDTFIAWQDELKEVLPSWVREQFIKQVTILPMVNSNV